jgi:hypothetical protein
MSKTQLIARGLGKTTELTEWETNPGFSEIYQVSKIPGLQKSRICQDFLSELKDKFMNPTTKMDAHSLVSL